MKELKKQFRAKDDFVHGDSDSINQVLHSSLKYGTKIKKIKMCHNCIALNFQVDNNAQAKIVFESAVTIAIVKIITQFDLLTLQYLLYVKQMLYVMSKKVIK